MIIVLLIIAVMFFVIMVCDCHRFVIRRYEIVTDKIKDARRFVVVADLHNKEYGQGNEKLLQAIREQKPDAVLVAGDLIVAKPGRDYRVAFSFVEALSEEYPVYYGIGNHEYRTELYPDVYGTMGEEYEKAIRSLHNVFWMNNEKIMFDENIEIGGISIDREYYRRFRKTQMEESYITELIGEREEDIFKILLAHNPQYGDTYMNWGADLTVSGHTHGGLIRIPFLGGIISPTLSLFPKYDGGFFEKEDKRMIVSRGLGTHTWPIRIFNPGELIVIDIHA